MEDDDEDDRQGDKAPPASQRPQKRARQTIVEDEEQDGEEQAGVAGDAGTGHDAFDENGTLDDADATLEDLFGSDDEE